MKCTTISGFQESLHFKGPDDTKAALAQIGLSEISEQVVKDQHYLEQLILITEGAHKSALLVVQTKLNNAIDTAKNKSSFKDLYSQIKSIQKSLTYLTRGAGQIKKIELPDDIKNYYLSLISKSIKSERAHAMLSTLWGKTEHRAIVQKNIEFILIHLYPLLRLVSPDLASRVLYKTLFTYNKSLDTDLKNASVEETITWNSALLFNTLFNFNEEILAEIEYLKHETNTAWLPAEVNKQIMKYSIMHKNQDSAKIATALARSPWFLLQRSGHQSKIFFILNYANYVAEHSSVPLQKQLLSNTVQFIVKGSTPIFIHKFKQPYKAFAYQGQIHIKDIQQRLPYSLNQSEGPYIDMALNVLTHEVNHVIKKAQAEESVKYFEDEYIAYIAGHLGLTGQLLSQRTAALYTIDLLMGFTDESYGYNNIYKAWKKSPSSFFKHLLALGFEKPEQIKNYDYNQLRGEAKRLSSEIDAPLLELDSWLTNNFK